MSKILCVFLFISLAISGCKKDEGPAPVKKRTPQNGTAIVWSKNYSNITVTIGGENKGVVNAGEFPVCGANTPGSLYMILTAGTHKVTAKDNRGNRWEGSVRIAIGQCNFLQLR